MIIASEYNLATGIFTGSKSSADTVNNLPVPAAGCAWYVGGWYDPSASMINVATGAVAARPSVPVATATLADAIAAKLDELDASSRGIRTRGVALATYGITVPTDDASMARLAVAAEAAPSSTGLTMNLKLAGQWVALATIDVPIIYRLACLYCQQVTEVECSLAAVVAGSLTPAAAAAVDVTTARIQWPLPTIAYTPTAGRAAPAKKTTIPVRRGII